MKDNFLSTEYLTKLDKYWRASNYLSVAQLYLQKNPLLRTPLKKEDIKIKIVGHWGTVPGQNFVYAHLNRVINKYDLNMILISGPGHGGNFFIANSYLEGVYSEVYPEITQDEQGMTRLCKQFSFPGGVASHCSPEVPGSIHEGGELGYSLIHAFGAVLDNPDLIATTIVGDGEAETGALATSWHLNKIINPQKDGIVLPILHLNGYKISNPTILSRISEPELIALFQGYGYEPYIVSGDIPIEMHRKMAVAMDNCINDIQLLKSGKKAKFPMIILRTPKGWTCPKIINGQQVENSFRAHQVPLTIETDQDIKLLEQWLKSYKPEELFDKNYKLNPEISAILPQYNKRISANLHANGGKLMQPLKLPDVDRYLLPVTTPGEILAQDTLELGGYMAELMQLNPTNYRVFSPDEMMSNRFSRAFAHQKRQFNAPILKSDENLSTSGQIIDSFLSEHACEGMLEGYILTGRHGMFNSYEAFVRVVDSMISQHIKWLKMSSEIPWRAPVGALNLLLTSNVWQQDHNGFTHQDPGFLDHICNKSQKFTKVFLPADANSLICTFAKCSASTNVVNAIIASKHPTPQWLTPEQAKIHSKNGIGIWDFACINDAENPDIIIASCGDTATIEALATITLIKQYLPKLNVRFINVLELFKLATCEQHADGLSDFDYDALFTTNTPIIFNFHGYPALIHQLTYKRHNQNLHVSGYQEQGTITTSFDMRVNNKIDRFNLMLKILNYAKLDSVSKKNLAEIFENKLKQDKKYIKEYGIDMTEILKWKFK